MNHEIHDEGGFEESAVFLRSWLPAATLVLQRQLGTGARRETVHVVLSDSETHRRRFPGRRRDLRALLDVDDDGAPAAHERYPRGLYAHGVTTVAGDRLELPEGISPGMPVIWLDIPTISNLADRLGVPLEAMLGRVAMHELSHVLRGHPSGDRRVAHGFIREGDAQRDTWQGLNDLLGDDIWANTARAARIAQVKLAAEQPTAYRLFGQTSPDRAGLDTGSIADRAVFTFQPARGILPLSRRPIIEVPVIRGWGDTVPSVGDDIYLYEPDLLVGPYHVIGRSDSATSPHAGDLEHLATLSESDKASNRRAQPVAWLHLRPSRELLGGDPADLTSKPYDKLRARRVGAGAQTRVLESLLGQPGQDFLRAAAERSRIDYVRSMEQLYADLARAVPASVYEYDPFQG